MKAHTNDFKNNIALMGKQLDSIITYEIEGDTIELGKEELNSITPHYEGSILKSVMKQLDIDSNVDIPVGTTINYQFGLKVGDDYEYLDLGNYIVESSKEKKDTNSYQIICYDKLLLSMKDYEGMGITYPISLRNYLNAICTHLGITFGSISDNFGNYNRMIQSELYLTSDGETMGYKFRDVLDEIAQATGSTICLNANDELVVRYITETNDTIDGDYLKDINVEFGEKYGPVNSIVLSRSGGADNVYLQDQQSITQNGLCEIKISDNQIMNWNDRSDYLPDLLSKLGGLQYYLNNYSSTGIMYYDLCDRYTVQIGNNYYSCVMFNDEQLITKGLEENVYTERPKESETDYSKANKTDRRINQTYLIVDKQNGVIQSVISDTTDTSNPNSLASKQSVLTQRVDSLESAISDIADITISGESSYATVDLDNINESEPIVINVKPVGTNISYLYPRANLYPSDTLYMPDRVVRFHNNTTSENFDYILPDDLLYYDSEHYDEFMLDYNSQTCQVTKKCKYNADGTVSLLSSPTINTYTYPTIEITEGDYTISLKGYSQGYVFVRLMTNNIYTDQFYTKAETNSKISQSASEITASVNQTLTNYSTTTEMNSAITVKANEINSVVATKVGNDEVISKINQSAEQVEIDANKISLNGKTINLTSDNIAIQSTNFNVDSNGNMTASSGTFNGTLNTTQNCTVGNDLFVGQNQSSTIEDVKKIKFTNNTYLQRLLFGGGSGEKLSIFSKDMIMLTAGTSESNDPNLNLSYDGFVLRSRTTNNGYGQISGIPNNVVLRSSDGTNETYVYVRGNSIEMSRQPSWPSDRRFKKNIKTFDTSWIDELKIKEFEYKDSDGKQIGLIAQDYIDKEYSKYFLNKDDKGYYSITYGNITNALIQYCQEMNKKLQEQQEEIERLKEMIKNDKN